MERKEPSMRTLKFRVRGQKLEQEGNFSNLIPGSSEYLQAEFEFDQEWNGMAKVAEFRRLNLPDAACWPAKISNNKCMVPAEVLSGNRWYINVIGQSREGIRIPTGRVEVRQDG